MLKMIFALASAILIATAINGCSRSYNVEMGVKKDGIQTSVSTDAKLLPVEQEHLEKVFGKPKADGKQSSLMAYPSKLMNGVWDNGFDGTGMVQQYDSPLGSAHVYMNMMGGNINLYEDQKVLHDCLDLLLNMFAEQIRTKAKDKVLGEKIAKLTEGRVRSDLHDVLTVAIGFNMAASMFYELSSDDSKESQEKQINQRFNSMLCAFLYQRGWINENEAVLIMTGAMDSPVAETILSSGFFRIIDMPVTQQNIQRITNMFENCLDDEFGDKLRKAMIKKCEGHPHLQVAANHASEILTNYYFKQQMQTGDWGKPVMTLGSWDSTTNTLSWSTNVSPWSIGLLSPPSSDFAIWAKPDLEEEKKYFDKPLSAKDVASLCVAWSNASKTQQDEAMKLMTAKKANKKDLQLKVINTLLAPASVSKKN